MSNDSNPKGISRRKFIRGISAGVVGGAVLPGSLKSDTAAESQPPHKNKVSIDLKVNGQHVRALVEPQTTLVQFLRDQLQLTGTKVMCNQAECGSCTVLLDGKAVYSCHILALDAAGKEVVTVEGLMKGEELHPIQKAFIKEDGFQCGFCTPGQVMAARALLLANPNPSLQEVRDGMSGNLCRCGAYPNIERAVLEAARTGGAK